jgi:hypothetical protein
MIGFLMTSHLNQDNSKNYFSRVWVIGGSNPHPASADQKTHCWKSIRSCCQNSITASASASYKVEFLMTSHLNQDSIKNHFCRVWAIGGNNPFQPQWTKKLIVGRASDLVVKTGSQHQHQHHTRLSS